MSDKMYKVIDKGKGTLKDAINHMSSVIEHMDYAGITHKFDVLLCTDVNENQCYVIKYRGRNTSKSVNAIRQILCEDKQVLNLRVEQVFKCENFSIIECYGTITNKCMTLYYCK